MIPTPLLPTERIAVAGTSPSAGWRVLPEETAIALTYDGAAHAVMMGTPADLEDFALGFSLTEGIVAGPGAIEEMEVIPRGDLGCEIRLRLAEAAGAALARRRRALAGPVGCGLCGIQSLAEAARPVPAVASGLRLWPGAIVAAMRALSEAQALNREAHALHAAGFWHPRDGLRRVREDVGRHNALDKLAGALARDGESGEDGVVVLTSRVSVEMVQKAARIGAPVVAAISAPTALAVRTAEACGITLVALARGAGFEVFTHPGRVIGV